MSMPLYSIQLPFHLFLYVFLLHTTHAAQYTTLLGAGPADSPCPIANSVWKTSPSGVSGAVVDTPDGSGGTTNLLYAFGYNSVGYLGSFPGEVSQCKSLCDSWPNFPNAPSGLYNLVPYNGVSGPCAAWSYDGLIPRMVGRGNYVNTPTCYLFSNGVCPGPLSYNANSLSYNFKSGGGPGQSGSSATGDPHFSGPFNTHFDFTGVPNTTYCAISDAHVHVNFFHGGRFDVWGENPHKPLTWIRKIAILFGHHSLQLVTREGARWQYDTGYLDSLILDGEEISLSHPGDSRSFEQLGVVVQWVDSSPFSEEDPWDKYVVEIANVIRLDLIVRPEIPLLRTKEDAIVHFDVSVPVLYISESGHGVLGQMYQKRRRSLSDVPELPDSGEDTTPSEENGESIIDGVAEDYVSSSLLSSDCRFSRFARASAFDPETAKAIELSRVTVTTEDSR